MEINKINIQEQFGVITDYWSLKELAKINNHVVNIVKLKGEFETHSHDNGDKLFLVIEGTMSVAFADKTIEINKGECIVIPKGTAHKPFAKEEADVLMFEPI